MSTIPYVDLAATDPKVFPRRGPTVKRIWTEAFVLFIIVSVLMCIINGTLHAAELLAVPFLLFAVSRTVKRWLS